MSFDFSLYLKEEIPKRIDAKRMARSIQSELKTEVKVGQFKRRATDSPMNTSGSLHSSIDVSTDGYNAGSIDFGLSMNKYGFHQSEGFTFSLWKKNDVSALQSWLNAKGIGVSASWFIKQKFGKWIKGTEWIPKASHIGVDKGFKLNLGVGFYDTIFREVMGVKNFRQR